MKLYACLGSGNCFKPWLALQQLEIEHELEMIDVLSGEQKGAPYLAINPLGVVPYLVTPDESGLGESNAMLWYLAEDTYLMPPDRATRAAALQWMFFEQARLEPFISPARFFTTILPQERANRATEIAQWQDAAKTGLARLDAHLAQNRFMLSCGYSIADIAVFGYVHVLDEAGLAMADFPGIARWTETVSETDRFKPLARLGPAATCAA